MTKQEKSKCDMKWTKRAPDVWSSLVAARGGVNREPLTRQRIDDRNWIVFDPPLLSSLSLRLALGVSESLRPTARARQHGRGDGRHGDGYAHGRLCDSDALMLTALQLHLVKAPLVRPPTPH